MNEKCRRQFSAHSPETERQGGRDTSLGRTGISMEATHKISNRTSGLSPPDAEMGLMALKTHVPQKPEDAQYLKGLRNTFPAEN